MNRIKLTEKEKELFITLLKGNKNWLNSATERNRVCHIRMEFCKKCGLNYDNYVNEFERLKLLSKNSGWSCGVLFYKILKSISAEERNEIILEALI